MNEKTILVTGCFNVLHPGHLRLLRYAKEIGGRLIVGVESDRVSGDLAHIHQGLRVEGVKSISFVDDVILIDEPITDFILRLRPDMVVKGREHERLNNPELEALKIYGGELVFSSGEMVFSSIDLIRKEFVDVGHQSINLPKDYMARHGITFQSMMNSIQDFSKLKICVIGDLIVDEYITCDPLGMSHEDPSIVVTPVDSSRFIGGAGIVAAHASSLGASVTFLSIAGEDISRDYATHELSLVGVNAVLLADKSRPTTLKQRYRSNGKSLFRVSHLHQGGISLNLQQQLFDLVSNIIGETDLLVFSDFNYGCLPQFLVEKITQLAKKSGVMMVADSQSSSQTGDIARFKSMDLITPTEREARISTRNREDGLVVLAEQLRRQSESKFILLKLGQEGLLIHAENDLMSSEWRTDRIGALNTSPKDVAGAGDSLLITSSMILAGGGDIWCAALVGSLAAAVQVGRVGNTALSFNDLRKEIH